MVSINSKTKNPVRNHFRPNCKLKSMVVLPLWGSPPGLRSCPCRWRRERWIWPCLRIQLPCCSMTFLEWPLSSLVNSAKRTKDYFVVQHCSRNFLTALTASKWTSLLSIGETLPVVLVPLAFSSGGGVRLVFKCELIQVSVLFFCTPNCRLRFAIKVLFWNLSRIDSNCFFFAYRRHCPAWWWS